MRGLRSQAPSRFLRAVVGAFALTALSGLPSVSHGQETISTPLARHGDWEVHVSRDQDGVYRCEAATWRDGIGMFEISVDDTGFYGLAVVMDQVEGVTGEDTFTLYLGSQRWDLHDAFFYYEPGSTMVIFGLGYSPGHMGFVGDVMRANRVTIHDWRGRVLRQFSLRGSSAAIQSLDDCREIIMGG